MAKSRPGNVVHRDRGIAILHGLETVCAVGVPTREMIRLEFAGEETVLVPVEELAFIWKYGSESGGVKLDRADGSTWRHRRMAAA